ncbi:putative ribonuclease H-like domain-containing protein [Tanacetum coccineum]|uniref:Ribonuclease H-like domain-containing protein n=1 Tax=Tanacetum coccineum TaxID=301880 RepID=A0ABQ5BV31_9ASTR
MQKTIMKQQYENFAASRSEGLDKIYDRFQKLISQLEIHGEVITQVDANLKLLRSLPSAWNNIALIMRNKADLDELSMDDLYNNLKVYEAEIKSQSSSSSNSQNVAFVSVDDTSSTNEAVNTAHDFGTMKILEQIDNYDRKIDGSQMVDLITDFTQMGYERRSSKTDMNDALLLTTVCLIGLSVDVHIKDGSVYSGIFHTASVNHPYAIVLKRARMTKKGKYSSNVANEEVIATLIIQSEDLVQVVAKREMVPADGVAGHETGDVTGAVASTFPSNGNPLKETNKMTSKSNVGQSHANKTKGKPLLEKGKQHKASCKTKLVSSISQPLQMLHMDLFGPTFVKSLNKKMYCLVVTDDFSRFSWVFFLASKDETSGILKTFITGIENQINHRVKIIRCDNGTEFKNSEMNQFCEMKGIKREFSVARTPQQNGVAERKNRTLIEAARTMLADSLLPTTFWAEAINTACYVQNRVLITKPHSKTPYELLVGRSPNLDFMRPFGCPVTILNTLDHLGKFEGKADEGFLVGYSVNSKAFRVFNSRTRKVEENLHIKFLENKSNVAGSGPEWLFDIDSLTKSMNYKPVTAGNQTNNDASIETNINAGQAGQEKASDHEYILLPFMPSDSPLSSSNQNSKDKDVDDESGKGDEGLDQERTDSKTGIFDGAYDDEDVGAESDLNNLETTINVSLIPIIRIHKDHPKDQIIGDLNLSTQTRRIINLSEENAMVIQALTDSSWIEAMQEELLQFKLQKFWTLVDLPKGKWAIGTKWVYRNKKDERGIVVRNKARLIAQDGCEECLFISQDKYVADVLKKFDFVTVKTASTPIETNKALIKDEEAEDMDVYLYRSMIGSLMYLTASRPDIMFVVYACARDLPFDLEAFSDSDYAGASLDRKSTTRGSEYVAAANCYGQVLWIQNQMLDYGFNFMNTKIYIDNESTICIVKKLVFHSKTKHIEIRHHFIRGSHEKKLIQHWNAQPIVALIEGWMIAMDWRCFLDKIKFLTFIHELCINMDPHEFSHVYLVVSSVLVMNRGMLLNSY